MAPGDVSSLAHPPAPESDRGHAGAKDAGRGVARGAAYLGALLLALPGWGLALFVAFIGHAVAVGNLFVVIWHAVLAFAWGVPIGVGVLGVLLAGTFFTHGRLVGGFLIAVADFVAVATLVWGLWPLDGGGVAMFILPLAASAVLALWAADIAGMAPSAGAARSSSASGP